MQSDQFDEFARHAVDSQENKTSSVGQTVETKAEWSFS